MKKEKSLDFLMNLQPETASVIKEVDINKVEKESIIKNKVSKETIIKQKAKLKDIQKQVKEKKKVITDKLTPVLNEVLEDLKLIQATKTTRAILVTSKIDLKVYRVFIKVSKYGR